MREPEETPVAELPLSLRAWDMLADRLSLSRRELQVVQGVFRGDGEAAIADALEISPHTVHSYVERVYRKLSVSGRAALVVRVFAEYLRLPPTRSSRPAPPRSGSASAAT